MIDAQTRISRRWLDRRRTEGRRGSNVRMKTAGALLSILLSILMAVAMAVALAGCTSSSPKPQPTNGGTSSGATATKTIPPQNQLPSPSAIRNDVKLHRQTAITSCTSKPGGWQASGKSVNPGQDDVHLTITVFFTTTAATVLDYATAKVKVPAGGTATWTAAANFHAEPNMLCVLRGVG